VDDEIELVQAMAERLELRGFTARGVRSAREALEVLAETEFDVVVADVKMPRMSGIQLARRIRRKYPGAAVVLLTGHGSRRDAEEGERAGAVAYLAKPTDLDDLIEVLRAAKDQRSVQ
jgi:DNA-binding NtrC family response regulator